MQYGGPFPLFRRRFGRGIKRSYSKSNSRETKIARKYGLKFLKVTGTKKKMNFEVSI